MARCPPGVICLTPISLLLAVCFLWYILYTLQRVQTPTRAEVEVVRQPVLISAVGYRNPMEDPNRPPLRTDTIGSSQQGILKSMQDKTLILPLMGSYLRRARDTWQYYTFKDGNNLIKLPVVNNKKNCMAEYGCDRISNGDTVYVEGYDGVFKAHIYDNALNRYY